MLRQNIAAEQMRHHRKLMRDFLNVLCHLRQCSSCYLGGYEANKPFARPRQYAAPKFHNPLSSEKSGQFYQGQRKNLDRSNSTSKSRIASSSSWAVRIAKDMADAAMFEYQAMSWIWNNTLEVEYLTHSWIESTKLKIKLSELNIATFGLSYQAWRIFHLKQKQKSR